MAKVKTNIYSAEDVQRAYLHGVEDGKREFSNDIIRALKIDDYVSLKIAEHEAQMHDE